jgi:hypothetical protein
MCSEYSLQNDSSTGSCISDSIICIWSSNIFFSMFGIIWDNDMLLFFSIWHSSLKSSTECVDCWVELISLPTESIPSEIYMWLPWFIRQSLVWGKHCVIWVTCFAKKKAIYQNWDLLSFLPTHDFFQDMSSLTLLHKGFCSGHVIAYIYYLSGLVASACF